MPLHSSTVLARSFFGLHHHIARVAKSFGGHDLTCLFALSTTVSGSDDLEETRRSLINRLNIRNSVGCFSSSLSGVELEGPRCVSSFACFSLAIFDSSEVVRFRSTIPGKSVPEVGRWHSFRRREPDTTKGSIEEGMNWEDIWNGNNKHEPLPQALLDADLSTVETLVYLTDRAPEGLARSLQKALPQATQLGLLAASTPFINGLPVTLFHSEQVYSSGAIGLALKGRYKTQINFLDTKPISQPMTVTSCDGNMIHLLSGANPTQLLLGAIEKSGLHNPGVRDYLTDVGQFSLGIIDETSKLSQLYQISAGDPSRGSISLSSEGAPRVGSTVQFFHRLKNTPISISSDLRRRLSVVTVAEALEQHQEALLDNEDAIVLEDLFLAGSDGGIVYHNGGDSDAPKIGNLVGTLASVESV